MQGATIKLGEYTITLLGFEMDTRNDYVMRGFITFDIQLEGQKEEDFLSVKLKFEDAKNDTCIKHDACYLITPFGGSPAPDYMLEKVASRVASMQNDIYEVIIKYSDSILSSQGK